ncbi:trypsin-like serine peptidase [Massilia niabensis]|uniref:Trypsin-like serine peptidase n=1 Tax=Massilia niabensis TaxID=544910 RepID=A0ABW0L4S9_9BURK
MQIESIAENLFFTTVRIDTVDAAGNVGSGTGFLYAHHYSTTQHAAFVVTNKHVVQGMRGGAITFHRRKDDKPDLGNGFRCEITDWNTAWFGHPSPDVDIAIMPFVPVERNAKEMFGIDLFYRYIEDAMLVQDSQAELLDAIESVTFIGYPNGVWDRRNLMPVARRGTTATPLSVDFEGTPRFVIDASVFGGSSGSPVFIVNQGMFSDKRGNTSIGSRVLFIGVVAAVFFRTAVNEVISIPIPTHTRQVTAQQEMIDLGIVFKARTVLETIKAFIAANPHRFPTA